MSLILPSIGAFGYVPDAGGPDGTRRKLVSTSASAATGIHVSIPSSTFSSDQITVAFWWRHPSASNGNASNTVYASQTGQYQLYTHDPNEDDLIGRYNGANPTDATGDAFTVGNWVFVIYRAGLNYAATTDVTLTITNGTLSDTNTSTGATGSSSDDITAAHTQYVMCDDNNGSASDDGFIGECFDFCVFDGIIDAADLQHDGSGNWENLSATGLAALVYRFDGQVTGNAAYDSSGNGLHGTVENSGVTLSASDLPPGANP